MVCMTERTQFKSRCDQSRDQGVDPRPEMRSKAMSFLSTLFHESWFCKSLKSTQRGADMQSNGLQEWVRGPVSRPMFLVARRHFGQCG